MADKKPKLFTMKVAPDELEKWKYFAQSKQMYLSDVIKRLMSGEELPETVPVKKEVKRRYSTVDPDLLRAINAIGSNINQIATRVNMEQKFDVVVQLRSIELQLERLLDAHKVHK